jgi:hypothetical protein
MNAGTATMEKRSLVSAGQSARGIVRLSALAPAVLSLACGATGIDPELRSALQEVTAETADQKHVGPEVDVLDTGPARYVAALHEAFREHQALELVAFIDRFYRAPANQGYEEVLKRLDLALREAGFDGGDERLQLDYIVVNDKEQAWTPVRGELVLLVEGEEPRVLHAFSKSEDVDRTMLPVQTPSCSITAEVALHLDELRKGMIFVTDVPASQVMGRARDRGAVAIISASIEPYNEDETGSKRHVDAVQFRKYPTVPAIPTAQMSPKSHQLVEAAVDRARKRGGKVLLRYQAEVLVEQRPLRTLMATIVGGRLPREAVVVVSHVNEPGACDNATGAAGLVEGARSLVELLQAGKLPWPDRTLVFLWGDEFRQSESWLTQTELEPVAGISSDMTGQSKETGAIALLERTPDPGTVSVLPPDAHTPWGAGRVSPEELKPAGLSVIARCALADVSRLEGGQWQTAEHPWEGGSDHDKFIQRGIPAVLFWHFTDFTYHTSLDRMQFVDSAEMRRTGVAIMATALAVAGAVPGDLARYLNSLEKERLARMQACEEARDIELAELWETWCLGTREWLRNLCLGIDEKIPEPRK